jgi:hypothetical protein
MTNAVSQALSVAQLGAAVWPTLADAECALSAFSAAQGWSLVTRRSEKYHYKCENAQGEVALGEVELSKVWLCSRGHQRQANEVHQCGEDKCEGINATGKLAAPPTDTPRLLASMKTGCSVSVRVIMIRKHAPANGRMWTHEDTPCAGYKLATAVKEMLPCRHNHPSRCSTRSAYRDSVTDS